MAKTQQELQRLIDDWCSDPIYDLDTVEGFEEHAEELAAVQAKWQANDEARKREADEMRKLRADFIIDESTKNGDGTPWAAVRLSAVTFLQSCWTDTGEFKLTLWAGETQTTVYARFATLLYEKLTGQAPQYPAEPLDERS